MYEVELGTVSPAFNPSTERQRPMDLYEFEAKPIFTVSSRTVRVMQRDLFPELLV